jgi:hypothetical protein
MVARGLVAAHGGNLRKVEQGAQSRFFMYDSLGRLLRAKNPGQAANAGLVRFNCHA